MVKLGDEVIDTVSGFKGIVISSTEYLQGCNRMAIQPKVNKDGTLNEPCHFDEPQLKVTKKAKVKQGDKEKGGIAYAQSPQKGISIR